jgi:hypothetical protein
MLSRTENEERYTSTKHPQGYGMKKRKEHVQSVQFILAESGSKCPALASPAQYGRAEGRKEKQKLEEVQVSVSAETNIRHIWDYVAYKHIDYRAVVTDRRHRRHRRHRRQKAKMS